MMAMIVGGTAYRNKYSGLITPSLKLDFKIE
jgi:hypothetical protein